MNELFQVEGVVNLKSIKRVVVFLSLMAVVTACSNNTTVTTGPTNVTKSSPSTVKEFEVVQPKLGDTLDIFEKKLGKHDSNYIDSYSFEDDSISLNTEDKKIKEVALRYSGKTFLTHDEAQAEIMKYIPDDSVKIKSFDDKKNGTSLTLYESKKIAETFKEMYSEINASVKGRILVRVSEGEKGSTVRREGETVARMTVGIDKSDLKKMGME